MDEKVKELITAIRIRCRQDVDFAVTSHKSMGFLRSMFDGSKKRKALLENKENRIPVLIALTGFRWLDSQKHLTQHCTSILIDELNHVCERDSSEITYIEKSVEGRTISDILDLFPWELPPSHMPYVSEGDSGESGDARGFTL